MNRLNPEEKLLDEITAELGPIPEFEPAAYYDPDGDCIEFLFSNEPFFARRLDGWVTVYHSESSDEIVGGLIKGVEKNLLKRFPGLRIDIKGNTAIIGLLLRAPAYETGDPVKQKTYQAMIEKADAHHTRAELQPA